MKKIVFAAALVVSGLLVGCNQLTQYTVSEQEINQALEKHNNFSKDIGVPGLADAHIVLRHAPALAGFVHVPGAVHAHVRVQNEIAAERHQQVLAARRHRFDGAPRDWRAAWSAGLRAPCACSPDAGS